MFAPAFAAIKARVTAGFTSIVQRWPNEDFLGEDPRPLRLPFLEVEVIGGSDQLLSFGSPGQNQNNHDGLIRFYISVAVRTGMDDALAYAETLATLMKRVAFGQVTGQIIRTYDFSVFHDVAESEDGNYMVLMCSCPFDFQYTL